MYIKHVCNLGMREVYIYRKKPVNTVHFYCTIKSNSVAATTSFDCVIAIRSPTIIILYDVHLVMCENMTHLTW